MLTGIMTYVMLVIYAYLLLFVQISYNGISSSYSSSTTGKISSTDVIDDVACRAAAVGQPLCTPACR
jgi:hypothetical protein